MAAMWTFKEKLADLCHRQWSGWMAYLFSKCESQVDKRALDEKDLLAGTVEVIPAWAVERWKRQLSTDYADLTEEEKDSDRAEADKFYALMEEHFGPIIASLRELPCDFYNTETGEDCPSMSDDRKRWCSGCRAREYVAADSVVVDAKRDSIYRQALNEIIKEIDKVTDGLTSNFEITLETMRELSEIAQKAAASSVCHYCRRVIEFGEAAMHHPDSGITVCCQCEWRTKERNQ